VSALADKIQAAVTARQQAEQAAGKEAWTPTQMLVVLADLLPTLYGNTDIVFYRVTDADDDDFAIIILFRDDSVFRIYVGEDSCFVMQTGEHISKKIVPADSFVVTPDKKDTRYDH